MRTSKVSPSEASSKQNLEQEKLNSLISNLQEVINDIFPNLMTEESEIGSEIDDISSKEQGIRNKFLEIKQISERGKDEIKLLSNLIDFSSLIYREKEALKEESNNNKEAISHKLNDIKQQIIGFISLRKDSLIDNEQNFEPQKNEPKLTRSLKTETREKKPESLLYNIFAAVPNDFSLEIINSLIESCDDLSKRTDIIKVMQDQKTISSKPDMSITFDLLIQKNIPKPSEEISQKMLCDSRITSGKNTAKLAKSLFLIRDDFEPIVFIFNQKILQNTTGQGILGEQEYLKSIFKTKKPLSDQNFVKYIKCLIDINQDELLKECLANQANSERLERIANHSEILKLAVERKLTKTFEILINAGFDPEKHPEGQLNVLAFACKEQSPTFLEPYFKAIKEKFGEQKLTQIINEKESNGKTLLTHAIEGKGYIDSIDFLMKNGANPRENYLQNLTIALDKGHAGVVDYLISKVEFEKNEFDQFNQIIQDKIQEDKLDYVICGTLLGFFEKIEPKNKETISKLKTQINEKIQKLEKKDIFRICQTDGEKSFESFIEQMKEKFPNDYTLENELNKTDGDNKTPLYYAISNNAYNRLIGDLIANGANPNLIGYETTDESKPINALSLAIKNKEDATVKLLLKSEKLSAETINSGFEEAIKEENNRSTFIKSLINNLEDSSLKSVPLNSLKIILERSLYAGLEGCAEKIVTCCENPDFFKIIDEIFIQALQRADVKVVKNFIDYGLENYLTKSANLNSNNNSENRNQRPATNPDIIGRNNSNVPISSIENSKQNLANDYFKIIFDLSEKQDFNLPQNSEIKNNLRSILNILIKEDFKYNGNYNDFTKNLKKFGITYKNPDICNIGCSIS